MKSLKYSKLRCVLLLLAIGALGKAGAGEVETNPPFKQQNGQLFIFAEKDHPVTFTAKKDKGSVTTSISATGGGSTSSGSGDTQTYTPNENAGVYTVTITVNHTGDNAKECTTNKPFTFTVATAKVEFADVVRGDSLPNSIAPGVEKEIQVTTTPSPLPDGHSATIIVDNGGAAANGSASVTEPAPATITQSGTIKIKGGTTQTDAGKSGKLKLKAQLDGDANKVIGEGKGFSTCAHPTSFNISPRTYYLGYGMVVNHTATSDSGDVKDLVQVWVQEKLDKQTGQKAPPFTAADPAEPAGPHQLKVGSEQIDKHKMPFSLVDDPITAAGTWHVEQHYEFFCKRCGMTKDKAASIPTAVFVINIAISKEGEGAKAEWVANTEKTGPGGPVKNPKPELAQRPNAPTNFAVTPVVAGDWIKYTATWTDNSSHETRYILELYDGANKIVTSNTAVDAQTTWVSGRYSVFKGKPMTLRLRAGGGYPGDSVPLSSEITVP